MRRPERRRTIAEKVAWLRGAIPDLAIRTTCLVGFPGETEHDFRELIGFVEEAQFDRLGGFAYSPQEGTRAVQYPDDVPDAVKRERLEELLEVQRAISAERLARFVGREVEVLIDRVADPLDGAAEGGGGGGGAAERGWSYGAPCEGEVRLAEVVCRRMPSIEMVRFVSSGTEATMAAVRVARAATRRDLVLKFEGCYHGHADGFLVRAGSGVATLGLPDSPGVPRALAELTVTAPFNDAAAVEDVFRRRGAEIAAVIVEPYVGNAGFIAPEPGFHATLRALCDAAGALLIFDEVMTGFRVAPGGAQARLGVRPDLTTLGKIVGGGMPVGAYGGRAELMRLVAPEGPVYQAGTPAGHPVAMAAGPAAPNPSCAWESWPAWEASPWEATGSCSSPTTPPAGPSGRSPRARAGRSWRTARGCAWCSRTAPRASRTAASPPSTSPRISSRWPRAGAIAAA